MYPPKESHCNQDKYGSYSTFVAARTACASDSNCAAVYDENCDDLDYTLCPVSYVEEYSDRSCLFPKNGR